MTKAELGVQFCRANLLTKTY